MVNVKDGLVVFRFYRPQAGEVFLLGEFNQWQDGQLRMTHLPDGYWQLKLRLPDGVYRFRYKADGAWFADFAAFGLEPGPFGLESVVRVGQPARLSEPLSDPVSEPAGETLPAIPEPAQAA